MLINIRDFAFVLLLLAACGICFAQNAVQLNTRGFELYEQGKYDEALEYFEKAALADDNYPYAHYNFACSLAILIARDYCEYVWRMPEVFDHLESAIRLRPQYRQKMTTDPDLEAVRYKYRFLVLAGFDPDDEEDLRKILCAVIWNGPRPGVFPASPIVTFYLDGRLEVEDFSIAGEGPGGYYMRTGTYEMSGKKVLIRVKDGDGRINEIQAEFRDGVILFPNGDYPELSDSEDVCGA